VVGVAGLLGAPVAGDVVAGRGAGSSLTSLGTITPLPVNGTAGNPASAEVSTRAGVWGGGSLIAFGAQAAMTSAMAARTSPRPLELIVMRAI
jgi:hypothetical protein